jgi:hypothetical protein
MPITIDGNGTITGASTLATTVASPTFTTPNINSAQFATVSGTAPIYPCRAWVNFNGTGTVAIRASGNVSSITDNGTGDYTVNFTTAMPDANYSTVASCGRNGTGSGGYLALPADSVAQTASAVRLYTINNVGGTLDTPIVFVAIFR